MTNNHLSKSLSTLSDTSPSVPKKQLYFPNLNGVRFIAAFSVLFHHIEQAKNVFGIDNIYTNHIIKQMGKQGVGLFFVLSGFLITYLLLHEKGKNQGINIKNFYIRRVLRIWPIYFIIVIAATLIFPNIPIMYEFSGNTKYNDPYFCPRLSLLLIVLPNLSFVFYELPYMCSQTWSIGVEEQFYYLWPWLIRANTWKKRLGIIAIFIAGTAAIFAFYFHFFTDYTTADLPKLLNFFMSQFRILMMVMGGLGAYLVFTKHAILKVLFLKKVQYIVYAILLTIIILGIQFKGLNLEVYSIFFCYFIVNVAANPDTIINLEYSVISYLGKISYGIYIYHIAVNIFVINLLKPYQNIWTNLHYNIVMYTFTVGLTILIASLSYHFLEQKLLAFKERFSH